MGRDAVHIGINVSEKLASSMSMLSALKTDSLFLQHSTHDGDNLKNNV
jgi:hypothetical protein